MRATAAATIAPGAGHLLLRHTRTGGLILATFLLLVAGVVVFAMSAGRTVLLQSALSSSVLVGALVGLLVAAATWISVIIRTWFLARPRGLRGGRRVLGIGVVSLLCLAVAAPFGYAARLTNSQRDVIETLFTGGGGTEAKAAISKPRLNVLLVGSDAGPDRIGARTDTMMVASLDTRTGRTTLFGLPRNIGYAQFPPGSPMAKDFPDGFHDRSDPESGNYLLNAVYAYGREHPDLAPTTPTADPGLNLLHQTVSYMLGLQLDYYVEVNMAGFASIIDAIGGLTVDVGPQPVPIGGILPSGKRVKPDGYVPAGVQKLTGAQALAFARSRTDSTDYTRMGRQRCLLQNVLTQKSPADLLANFQAIAAATTNSVSTNIPQQVLPKLVDLAGSEQLALESVSFDPNLSDPAEGDGRFNTGRPNFPRMRDVVRAAVAAPPAPASTAAAPTSAAGAGTSSPAVSGNGPATGAASGKAPPPTETPTSLADSCR